MVPNRWQAIIWIDDGLVYWCIYAIEICNQMMKIVFYMQHFMFDSWMKLFVSNFTIFHLIAFCLAL